MGRKKKPFIDKKTAHKFGVVHRSQRDPLQADEEESQRVLVPLNPANSSRAAGENGEEVTPENRKDCQKLYGINFEDEYDYMQHLKSREEFAVVEVTADKLQHEGPSTLDDGKTKQFGKLSLPAVLFASETEESEGMLSRGIIPSGPNPDWDPDIIEALDGDVDFEDPDNILDDDFIMFANNDGKGLIKSDHVDNSDNSGSDYSSDFGEDMDTLGSEKNFDGKSRFTEYSMTSSVMHRTHGLQLLDDKFETLMADYEDDKIGGLDEDATTGMCDVSDVLVDKAIQEFEEKMQMTPLMPSRDGVTGREVVAGNNSSSDSDSETDILPEEKKREEMWDCESVISTYSNLYNHPKVIGDERSRKPIKLIGREGIPEGVLHKREIKQQPKEEVLVVKASTVRPRDESPNSRKERKQNIKEERRVRRTEKKEKQIAFKSEKLRQEKAGIGKVTQIAL